MSITECFQSYISVSLRYQWESSSLLSFPMLFRMALQGYDF
nr:MAG TPA: hypothetical protein [Caudoviricetes sp.]